MHYLAMIAPIGATLATTVEVYATEAEAIEALVGLSGWEDDGDPDAIRRELGADRITRLGMDVFSVQRCTCLDPAIHGD